MHGDSSGKESEGNPVLSRAQTDHIQHPSAQIHENMQPYVSLRMGVLHSITGWITTPNYSQIGDKHFDESEANMPNSLQDWAWGILLSFSNQFGFRFYFFTNKLFSPQS